MKPISLEGARMDDWEELAALVSSCGLPLEGLRESLKTALVAREDGRIVGAVALELYAPDALLRSLVVAPDLRGRGLGHRLAGAALDLAGQRGMTRVYLLTETAAPFFHRRGFRDSTRAEVPEAVRGSVEFRSACPSTARVLTFDLSGASE
ncbi:MAG TPA: arsenic resistance N-acetyltransferase ArsN2 [Thermoanaerobaculia bacterium]|jgi:amino-acid N-acetyltransferase|nr:arsenic resistance N-acetyltransferase ArsN2 [Thermoanaerobaculia bacterium]